jgi:hypothetical protein
VNRTWHERTSKLTDQERQGESESTMASENNCKGQSKSRRTIILCCKRCEVHTKTEIMSQSKQEVNGNQDWKPGARCQFLIQVWIFLKKYTKPWGAISTSQWFCAQKFVQISTSQQFCGQKILQRCSCTILSMKNPTKILYLTICPPENIKNGKLVSTTYTWHILRQYSGLTNDG